MKTNFSNFAVIFSMVATMAVSFTSCDKNGDTSNGPINPQTQTSYTAAIADLKYNMPDGKYMFISSEIFNYVDVTATYTDAQGVQQTVAMTSDKYATGQFRQAMQKELDDKVKMLAMLSSAKDVKAFQIKGLHSFYLDPATFGNEAVKKSLKFEVKAKDGVNPSETADFCWGSLDNRGNGRSLQAGESGKIALGQAIQRMSKQFESFVKY